MKAGAISLVLMFATGHLASGAATVSLPSAAALDAVKAVYRQRVDAIQSGDLEKWVNAHAHDVRFVVAAGPDVVGQDGVRTWGRPFFETFVMNVTETVDEIAVAGDLAFIRYGFTGRFNPKSAGAPIESNGKGILLFKRQPDKSWRITHNIYVEGAAPLPQGK